jgi:hypothetical protein
MPPIRQETCWRYGPIGINRLQRPGGAKRAETLAGRTMSVRTFCDVLAYKTRTPGAYLLQTTTLHNHSEHPL